MQAQKIGGKWLWLGFNMLFMQAQKIGGKWLWFGFKMFFHIG